jgi:hypothetical protein
VAGRVAPQHATPEILGSWLRWNRPSRRGHPRRHR